MDIDAAVKTMTESIHKKTGKTVEEWIAIVKPKNLARHGDIIKFLKEEHGFTHGFANLIAHKTNASDAGSADDKDDLVAKQYKGKQNLKPLYDKLLAQILSFGSDIEVAPKNAYVSLRRKKQFAMLQPATKTRFEIGLNIKGQEAKGVLEIVTTANAMFSHKIKLESEKEVTKEVFDWLKKAYELAG